MKKLKNKVLSKFNIPSGVVQTLLLLLIIIFAPLIEIGLKKMYMKLGLKINDSFSQTIITASFTLLTVNLTSKFNMRNQKKSIIFSENHEKSNKLEPSLSKLHRSITDLSFGTNIYIHRISQLEEDLIPYFLKNCNGSLKSDIKQIENDLKCTDDFNSLYYNGFISNEDKKKLNDCLLSISANLSMIHAKCFNLEKMRQNNYSEINSIKNHLKSILKFSDNIEKDQAKIEQIFYKVKKRIDDY